MLFRSEALVNFAGEYAHDSEESAETSRIYAQLAEMSAESHGFFEMRIDEHGHLLYICTETFDDIVFELIDGRLIASYGT